MDLSKHYSILSCIDVNEICKPINKMGINFFLYLKIFYEEKKYILLSNSMIWNEHAIIIAHKPGYDEHRTFEAEVMQNSLLSIEMYPNNRILQDAYNLAGVKHGFIMPFIGPTYKEIYYFGSNSTLPAAYNLYLNNIPNLLQFIGYFKDKAKKIITVAEQFKLNLPGEYTPEKNDPTKKFSDEFLTNYNVNRKYLPGDLNHRYLSLREYECIRWTIHGKSAEEIALIVGLSQRTIEKYLENLKNKFDCTKTSQLIYKLTRLGLTIW